MCATEKLYGIMKYPNPYQKEFSIDIVTNASCYAVFTLCFEPILLTKYLHVSTLFLWKFMRAMECVHFSGKGRGVLEVGGVHCEDVF